MRRGLPVKGFYADFPHVFKDNFQSLARLCHFQGVLVSASQRAWSPSVRPPPPWLSYVRHQIVPAATLCLHPIHCKTFAMSGRRPIQSDKRPSAPQCSSASHSTGSSGRSSEPRRSSHSVTARDHISRSASVSSQPSARSERSGTPHNKSVGGSVGSRGTGETGNASNNSIPEWSPFDEARWLQVRDSKRRRLYLNSQNVVCIKRTEAGQAQVGTTIAKAPWTYDSLVSLSQQFDRKPGGEPCKWQLNADGTVTPYYVSAEETNQLMELDLLSSIMRLGRGRM